MFLFPNKETVNTYNVLLNSFATLGQPDFVISDADYSLILAISELAILLGFKYTTAVPYSQQQNRDLKQTIKKVLHDPEVVRN